MDIDERYTRLLSKQIAEARSDNRHLEFKSNYQDADKIGRYVSALSNGACLDGEDFAYLYFGVEDGTWAIKGTAFRPEATKAKGSEDLELYLRRMTNPKIDFRVNEFHYGGNPGLRMVAFKIPAAAGEPTCFEGKPWIRINSHTTELSPYTEWMREIYNSATDWSAQAIEDAGMEDLDPDAIRIAREGYAQRFPQLAEDCRGWAVGTFLDKAGLTMDGTVTRTALLLLGKAEAAPKLGHIAQIAWKCFQGGEVVGDLFTIPMIKTTTELLGRIRNYRFKIYPQASLIPAEVWKYDTRSILEGLHNCIAHQDYGRNARIIVTEREDSLTFENSGGFFDGGFDDYILGTKTPRRYRNPFLMKAMVNTKMIDSQGYGIHNMFVRQKERYLPLPDYGGTDSEHVALKLPGAVMDINYSLLLLTHSDMSLTDALLLDRLQKGGELSGEATAHLRKMHLIEGRKPHIFIEKGLAQTTGKKVEYSKHKGLEYKSCEAMLTATLADHGTLTREETDRLLWNALSDRLNDRQKKDKIGNILRKMRQAGLIANETKGNQSTWSLVKH